MVNEFGEQVDDQEEDPILAAARKNTRRPATMPGLPGTEPVSTPQRQSTPVASTTAGGGVDPYARVNFQNAWGASPTHTPDALKALIASDPSFAGITTNGKDIVNLPGYTEAGTGIYRGPESIDAIGDVGGANSWNWGGVGEAGSYGGSSPAAGSGGSSTAAGVGSAAGAGAFGAGGPYDAEMHDQILKLLARGNSPVTSEDVNAQFEPVSRQFQRGAQTSREAAAERLAQEGLNNGGSGGPLDAEVNSINENLAENQAGAMGNLMLDEQKARRQDVVNALQFAQGEERLALQLQLAQMDKDIRQQEVGIQRQGLGLQSRSLDLQGQSLGQQNQQFYDRLAFDYGSANNNSDEAFLLSLLG